MNGFAHVAIDGPAGSGKTTVALALARRLDVLYLDTGAMYRAVAFEALRTGTNTGDEAAVVALVTQRPLRVTLDRAAPLGFRIYTGSAEFGAELYTNDVSRVVSVVAAHPEVRRLLVERQRAIAREGPVIMAGRDIGTVVLPDAPFKIFLTATVAERVERRFAELTARGAGIDRPTVHAEIVERDHLDQTRATSPLRPAHGAVTLDSTGLPVEAVVERIAGLVRARSGSNDASGSATAAPA